MRSRTPAAAVTARLPGPASRAGLTRFAAAAVVAVLLLPGAARAQEMTELRTARRDVNRVRQFDVDVEYAAGRILVERADPGFLYQTYLRYDASRVEPGSEWTREDGVGRLRLGMEGPRDLQIFRWDEGGGLDINIRGISGLGDLDEASSSLELGLSRRVPSDLGLAIGAAESTLRLGGIPITSLSLETGASETELSFDRPNPEQMESLEIEAGAASLRTRSLGNARFGRFRLEGGVGDVRLDFTGEWTRDARATVEVGLGSLRLIFPEDLGVRIRRESFLASFDVPAGFVTTDDGYRTENWSSAEHRLTLDLSAALGSVRISVRD